jgi:hypothetical protein
MAQRLDAQLLVGRHGHLVHDGGAKAFAAASICKISESAKDLRKDFGFAPFHAHAQSLAKVDLGGTEVHFHGGSWPGLVHTAAGRLPLVAALAIVLGQPVERSHPRGRWQQGAILVRQNTQHVEVVPPCLIQCVPKQHSTTGDLHASDLGVAFVHRRVNVQRFQQGSNTRHRPTDGDTLGQMG